MDKHQKKFEEFDQFVDGSLEPDTNVLFKAKLTSDAELSKDFEDYKLLTDGIKYTGRKKLIQEMKNWETQFEEEPGIEGKSRKLNVRYYAMAAVIGFFIVAGIVLYFNINTGYQHLVASYYQPYSYIPETTRGEEIDENSKEKIFGYYDRGEYVQAIQLINNLPNDQRNTVTDYLLANAYQAVGKYNMAIDVYSKIIASGSEYTSGAKWYLALCYLSTEDRNKAETLLKELKESKTSYGPKATALLKDLE